VRETFEPEAFGTASFLGGGSGGGTVVEVGPRLSFTSAFSTNAVAVFGACGVPVTRMERYRRFEVVGNGAGGAVAPRRLAAFVAAAHDRMTEWALDRPLTSFGPSAAPAPVRVVRLLEEGPAALAALNADMGLSMDAWDQAFYYDLFTRTLARNPTDVEMFDISQSNSEHSRHWFFKGALEVDGVPVAGSLMGLVQSTLAARPGNSVVAFADNSSAIRGFRVPTMLPATPGAPCSYVTADVTKHCLLTAETHNFPTGVAPFPGAETGTGGRIRDTHATGRGSHVIAGTAGYAVGNLRIPGYDLPWEAADFGYPANLAAPVAVAVEASNGASDYGNKFGEPVVAGFARSVGLRLPGGERREYVKPIMFTAGVGALDDEAVVKGAAAPGMLVVKLGGPAYRIGMGGSAASSMLQGDNKAELDFNAVQRGDAEMEAKVNRVVRACCELRDANPIVSIHDQGAGGNCNVLKEIVAPAGGVIELRAIPVGDASLSALEIWGAEYQESDALLIRPEAREAFAALCARERVPVAFVGVVTGDGRVVLRDADDGSTPVDLDLEAVLGSMPRKTFKLDHAPPATAPFHPPPGTTVAGALDRVLRLLAVGSKRFLTNKVDRSVTGLVAQQQCVGPLHTPLADVAVVALSYTDTVGVATSIGEAPLKGLASPPAMARMAVGEAVTNLAAARVSDLADAKCSANWMWAAKLPGEGAALYDACAAMADFMIAVGVAVDGGKDSLSMAARAPDGEMVKAPGTLVVSLYAPCTDITATATPDVKAPGASALILLDLSAPAGAPPRARLGGSALAQVYGGVGSAEQVPDCDCPATLVAAFNFVQRLRDTPGTLLALHDRSDGGLLVAALEMAFAGNAGLALDLPAPPAGAAAAAAGVAAPTHLEVLFAEELGLVLEVPVAAAASVVAGAAAVGVAASVIGRTLAEDAVTVDVGGERVVGARMTALRDVWEATSFALEARQADPSCVASEARGMATRKAPAYHLTFDPAPSRADVVERPLAARHRVAVLRAEGTNGDREMAAALMAAGFDAVDVAMSDLLDGTTAVDGRYRGLVFPGGFSFADVLDSAKGWAGMVRFHPALLAQFAAFYARTDTFSLGVCNGCQLLALLGWVPFGPGGAAAAAGAPDLDAEVAQPRFVHNASGRFESRFSTVRIADSPAVMFAGMAGSVLGVWVAHGEGRAHFADARVLAAVRSARCVPLEYVDDDGAPTEVYPANPNGSPGGIAGLCTPDGRHLAIMPHPERVVRMWQWPWAPPAWRASLPASPWLRMFQNAASWCDATPRAA